MVGKPDRERWGNPRSYQPPWVERAKLAASLVPDGASILEIGVGAGNFRELVSSRCAYCGADLEPLDDATLRLDLDADPLPEGRYDYVVLLGVLEYLHTVQSVISKLCGAADKVLLSYCVANPALSIEDLRNIRQNRGWINNLSKTQLLALFEQSGFGLRAELAYNSADDFEQLVMVFAREAQNTRT